MLSVGTLGCNFTCAHCQNWQIARADVAGGLGDLRPLPVDRLPLLAGNNECAGVAWTYNEPTIWIEYVIDGARVAHEHGLYTVMVTNGYITTEALDAVAPHLDAYRVDVKGFDDELYKRLCRVPDHEPVLAAAERALHEHGCHVEIVTNVIPTLNDDEATLRGIAAWMVERLGAQDALARDALPPGARALAPAGDADPHARARASPSATRRASSSSTSATSLGTRARTRSAPTATGSSCGARATPSKTSPCAAATATCAARI